MTESPATQRDNLKVTRWTRYGKDRLYVTAPDGTATGVKVGWCDLVTGERTVTAPDYSDAFHAALDAHRSAGSAAVPTTGAVADRPPTVVTAPVVLPPEEQPTSTDAPDPAPTSAPAAVDAGAPNEPGWVDLAQNVPGQAARAVADAEWAALKDRSKLIAYGTRLFGVKTTERNWRVGADGEATVGARLEKLTSRGWHVLHAVPVGDRGSDIDHVLIGPGGVWTINTKNHPGGKVWVSKSTVMVNGTRVPYLRNSRHEADRAARLLSAAVGFAVPVRPALVFLTGTIIPEVTIKSRPTDVSILDRMDIPGAFKRTKPKFDAEQVAAVYAVARRSTTWQPGR